MRALGILFGFVLLSSSALAAWSEDFVALRDVARSYEDSGSICEEVARLEVQRDFPAPQYEVHVGIAYGN